MKRLLAFVIVLTLLVIGGTFVSSEGQTRRHRSKFGRKARTAAIIAGGAGVGAVVAGKKGAAIGAGGAGLYASTGALLDSISAVAHKPQARC